MRSPGAFALFPAFTAFILCGACTRRPPPSREIPNLGTRVRVIVPAIGPGWRTGIFNQTRQSPPCYLVLLFHPGPVLRIAVTVPIAAVTRLQVSLRDSSNGARFDPSAASLEGEKWREVLPDSAQAVSRACPREPSGQD
jgi:hypothetical protein